MQKFQVSFIGLNTLFGRTSSLLLKQSPFIKCIKLYDEANIDPALDIAGLNAQCKVKAFLGKEQLKTALKDSDIIVIGEDVASENSKADLFSSVAPKILDYAKAIAFAAPEAIVVVAASPLNSLLPLTTQMLVYHGCYNCNKVFGATTVDNMRANALLSSHLKLDVRNVMLPVIGGSSEETRVPVFSQAKPNVSLPMDVKERIIKDVKRGDLEVKKRKSLPESLNKAYATSSFLNAIMAGLCGETTMSMTLTKTTQVPGVEYFALPVMLGRSGVVRRFGIPRLSILEQDMVTKAIQSMRKDVEIATQYWKHANSNKEVKKELPSHIETQRYFNSNTTDDGFFSKESLINIIEKLQSKLNPLDRLLLAKSCIGDTSCSLIHSQTRSPENKIKDQDMSENKQELDQKQETIFLVHPEKKFELKEAKQSKETAKLTQETAKQSKETAKLTTEAAKQSKETAKLTKEAAKQSKETAKLTKEAAKQSKETAKLTKEAAKQSKETAKLTKEAAKQSKETAKLTKEAAKQSKETAKLTKEAAKQSKETAKQTKEIKEEFKLDKQKSNKFESLVQKTENIISDDSSFILGNKKSKETSKPKSLRAENSKLLPEFKFKMRNDSEKPFVKKLFEKYSPDSQKTKLSEQNKEVEIARREKHLTMKLKRIAERKAMNDEKTNFFSSLKSQKYNKIDKPKKEEKPQILKSSDKSPKPSPKPDPKKIEVKNEKAKKVKDIQTTKALEIKVEKIEKPEKLKTEVATATKIENKSLEKEEKTKKLESKKETIEKMSFDMSEIEKPLKAYLAELDFDKIGENKTKEEKIKQIEMKAQNEILPVKNCDEKKIFKRKTVEKRLSQNFQKVQKPIKTYFPKSKISPKEKTLLRVMSDKLAAKENDEKIKEKEKEIVKIKEEVEKEKKAYKNLLQMLPEMRKTCLKPEDLKRKEDKEKELKAIEESNKKVIVIKEETPKENPEKVESKELIKIIDKKPKEEIEAKVEIKEEIRPPTVLQYLSKRQQVVLQKPRLVGQLLSQKLKKQFKKEKPDKAIITKVNKNHLLYRLQMKKLKSKKKIKEPFKNLNIEEQKRNEENANLMAMLTDSYYGLKKEEKEYSKSYKNVLKEKSRVPFSIRIRDGSKTKIKKKRAQRSLLEELTCPVKKEESAIKLEDIRPMTPPECIILMAKKDPVQIPRSLHTGTCADVIKSTNKFGFKDLNDNGWKASSFVKDLPNLKFNEYTCKKNTFPSLKFLKEHR